MRPLGSNKKSTELGVKFALISTGALVLMLLAKNSEESQIGGCSGSIKDPVKLRKGPNRWAIMTDAVTPPITTAMLAEIEAGIRKGLQHFLGDGWSRVQIMSLDKGPNLSGALQKINSPENLDGKAFLTIQFDYSHDRTVAWPWQESMFAPCIGLLAVLPPITPDAPEEAPARRTGITERVTVTSHKILPDGGTETVLSDGTVKITDEDGNYTVTDPEGNVTHSNRGEQGPGSQDSMATSSMGSTPLLLALAAGATILAMRK
jgi:hypothetical protein